MNIKINILDSGLGGIVFKENLEKEIKHCEFELMIDSFGFPYGDKELEWLKERLYYLIGNCKNKIILIACNTLSSIIYYYNLKFDKTILDVITPTISYIKDQKFKNVVILATKNTIKMNVYSDLLNSLNIKYIEATKLISDLEYGLDYNDELNNILKEIPSYFDAILLGCTHLSKIKEEILNKVKIKLISQDDLYIEFLNK